MTDQTIASTVTELSAIDQEAAAIAAYDAAELAKLIAAENARDALYAKDAPKAPKTAKAPKAAKLALTSRAKMPKTAKAPKIDAGLALAAKAIGGAFDDGLPKAKAPKTAKTAPPVAKAPKAPKAAHVNITDADRTVRALARYTAWVAAKASPVDANATSCFWCAGAYRPNALTVTGNDGRSYHRVCAAPIGMMPRIENVGPLSGGACDNCGVAFKTTSVKAPKAKGARKTFHQDCAAFIARVTDPERVYGAPRVAAPVSVAAASASRSAALAAELAAAAAPVAKGRKNKAA